MMKRLFVLAILALVALPAFATDNTYDPHILVFPFAGSLTTTTGATSTTNITAPAGMKLTACYINAAGAVTASTTDYFVATLRVDGTAVAVFTSSGTALVDSTLATMTTPLTSSTQWVAKDSEITAAVTKVGAGCTLTNAALHLHYINASK